MAEKHPRPTEGLRTPDFELSGVALRERLKTNPDQKDMDGLPRPMFTIAGRDIVFRNRQETPDIADRNTRVVGDVTPVRIEGMSDSEYARLLSYTQHQNESKDASAVMVVTNAPRGIVHAASELTQDRALGGWLSEIGAKMDMKEYDHRSVRECVDYILAAIAIDDNGADAAQLDSDGFAIALAALSGNEEAAALVEARRQKLLENEESHKAEERAKYQEELKHYQADGIEPLPLKNMALVHTTAHELEMDSNGNVVLRPAAQRRDDELPRSTLHFTINSRVEAHAQAQDAWAVGSRMVVANLARTSEYNHGRLPAVLNGVDTYYSLNPGEGLYLDGATIAEAVASNGSGDLVEVKGSVVQYVLKMPEDYTASETQAIDEYIQEYGVNPALIQGYDKQMQEVALRVALGQQGIANEDMDIPSTDGHGMKDHQLAFKIYARAAALGIGAAKHFDQPHSRAEAEMYAGMSREYVTELAARMIEPTGSRNYIETGLEMRRQQLVSGALPARPLAYERNTEFAVPSMTF